MPDLPKRILSFLSPIQLLLLGYGFFTIGIAYLLTLPVSSAQGTTQPFFDALYMAASGVSTTGLCVVDIGSYYSIFGQLVLLTDIQIGGIGYMAILVMIWKLFKQKSRLQFTTTATESVSGATAADLFPFFRWVIVFTLGFELLGAGILYMNDAGFSMSGRHFYYALFHAINAFCTAGFSLFPDSLCRYQSNTLVTLTISILSLIGGIGFYTLIEVKDYASRYRRREYPRIWSLHTRIVVTTTLAIVSGATLLYFLFEPGHLPAHLRFQDAFFQVVSASTTDGFNTVNIANLQPVTLLTIILLMAIGASPGSTGGGMKTSTLGVMVIALAAYLRQSQPTLYGRTLPASIIQKAFYAAFLFSTLLLVTIFALVVFEKAPLLAIIFESASALGNTGLSMGISSAMTPLGKFIITLAMFIGRVGPLSFGMLFLTQRAIPRYRYPEEDVFIG